MKKIIMCLILLLSMLGCTSDTDYINTVKGISFDDGVTVEEIAKQDAIGMELYYTNNLEEKSNNPLFGLLLYDEKFLNGLKIPKEPKLKWDIEGKTKNGKVVIAYNDVVKIKISTTQNGDYIQVNKDNIDVYSVKTNKQISAKDLQIGVGLYTYVLQLKEQGILKK